MAEIHAPLHIRIFALNFFAHLHSCKSIWKSQYLEVIGDQWSKCGNNSAYFLVILLSSVFIAPGLLGECSGIAPKRASFRSQFADMPNRCEYHSERKSCKFSATSDLEKGILPNTIARDCIQKTVKMEKKFLKNNKQSTIMFIFIHYSLIPHGWKVRFLRLQLMS